MSDFVVTYAGRESDEQFANYIFDVTANGRKIAQIMHDHRGDYHWIRSPLGSWQAAGCRLLEGGGPQPLILTSEGCREVASLK